MTFFRSQHEGSIEMSNWTRTSIGYSALVGMFLVSAMSANAGSGSDASVWGRGTEHQSLPNCLDHKAPEGDCHVVDESNYHHLKLVDRSKLGEHGRREMLEYQRKSRWKTKN